MDSMKKVLFGTSKKDREPAPAPAPVVVAQPVQSVPPSYAAAHSYAPAPHPGQPQPYPQHGAPYPGHRPMPAPRQAPGPLYTAPSHLGQQGAAAPYPGQHQPYQGHPQQAAYPGQYAHHQQQVPVAAPRQHHQAPAPEMPSGLRSMRSGNPGIQRTKSLTGCLMDRIPVDVSRKYAASAATVSLPVGFRPMEAPNFSALIYDFQLEQKILRL